MNSLTSVRFIQSESLTGASKPSKSFFALLNSDEDTETNQEEDDAAVDDSIESIPFISEQVKKKRTRSSK